MNFQKLNWSQYNDSDWGLFQPPMYMGLAERNSCYIYRCLQPPLFTSRQIAVARKAQERLWYRNEVNQLGKNRGLAIGLFYTGQKVEIVLQSPTKLYHLQVRQADLSWYIPEVPNAQPWFNEVPEAKGASGYCCWSDMQMRRMREVQSAWCDKTERAILSFYNNLEGVEIESI